MNNVAPALLRTQFLLRSVMLCIIMGAAVVFAAEPIIITSVSKQFVVRGMPMRSALAASAKEDVAYLDPATLAVTCETVKRAVSRELGWQERWQGNIYINIHPVRRDNNEPELFPFQTDRGWSYRVNMPDEVPRRMLMETLVEALLLEYAARNSTNDFELPPWLVIGLTERLSQGLLAGVALQAHPLRQFSEQPNVQNRTVKHMDVAQSIRHHVVTNGVLTVDQLNWPEFEPSDAVASEEYRHSAHLFVRELLGLRGGPEALSTTLAKLSHHLNWQTAFLRAFNAHFTRMLDVEKWWTIQITRWKSHQASVLWMGEEAVRQLEEILYTPMEVKIPEDSSSHLMPVALQTVLTTWDYDAQAQLIEAKLAQLQRARVHCTPEFIVLIDTYRSILSNYVEARSKRTGLFAERRARAAVAQAVRELDALDQQRAKVTARWIKPGNQNQPPGQQANAEPKLWSEPRAGILPSPDSPPRP